MQASSTVTSHSAPGLARENGAAMERAASVPWYIWCAVLAITSTMIGGNWDVSWHESIGRDTFWTPAHLAIYLGGMLSGVTFGYIILHTTFSRNSPLDQSAVRIWGFRAPLGAFIAAWGGIDMLVSAPFDDWWHRAYGLDVTIISPPHIVLIAGDVGIIIGVMVLISGYMNHVSGVALRQARWLFLYACGIILAALMFVLQEETDRPFLHNPRPYVLLALLTPIAMVVGWRVTRMPFAATTVAGIYTCVILAFQQILPLFPAEPKLGPVYQHVTHFIPPAFPILLLLPAFGLDLIFQRARHWTAWKLALAGGCAYVALLVAVEWPLASFLMSSGAQNRFFGANELAYDVSPQSFIARNVFFETWTSGAQLWGGLLLACALAILSIRFAISRGDWLRGLQR
jgi:hypothetical protein